MLAIGVTPVAFNQAGPSFDFWTARARKLRNMLNLRAPACSQLGSVPSSRRLVITTLLLPAALFSLSPRAVATAANANASAAPAKGDAPSAVATAGGVLTGAFESICKDSFDNDQDGLLDCADPDCQSPGGDCVPAPPLDRTVATTAYETTRFLITGSNPLQKGVTAQIGSREVSHVTGSVVDEHEKPLPGVRVSVIGHPELGYTYSLSDGQFDLAVKGGSRLVLDFKRDGYLPVTRDVTPRVRSFAYVDTLGMVPRAGVTTSLAVDAPQCQVALGPLKHDKFGKRQPLFVFEPQTTAQASLPNGKKQALSAITLTLTEYPPHEQHLYAVTTPEPLGGFHYCINRDVAEARALGATVVDLSKPATMYFENFVKLSAGSAFPTQSNDSATGTQVREVPSHVVKIVGKAKGVAKVDGNGDGKPDNATTLARLGFTQCELEALAKRYPIGTSLVRSQTMHL